MLKTYFLPLLVALCLLLTTSAAQAQRAAPTATVQAAAAPGGGTQPPQYVVPEEPPWSHLIDSLTAPLDKSRIPSGIRSGRAADTAWRVGFERGPGWFTKG